jgi:hypothetical protein
MIRIQGKTSVNNGVRFDPEPGLEHTERSRFCFPGGEFC